MQSTGNKGARREQRKIAISSKKRTDRANHASKFALRITQLGLLQHHLRAHLVTVPGPSWTRLWATHGSSVPTKYCIHLTSLAACPLPHCHLPPATAKQHWHSASLEYTGSPAQSSIRPMKKAIQKLLIPAALVIHTLYHFTLYLGF